MSKNISKYMHIYVIGMTNAQINRIYGIGILFVILAKKQSMLEIIYFEGLPKVLASKYQFLIYHLPALEVV